MKVAHVWPALRCASRGLSSVALALCKAEPKKQNSFRGDVEMLFAAYSELVPLYCWSAAETVHLNHLGRRYADIDDPFAHGTEFYQLVALCMSVWDLRTTSSEPLMKGALEHGLEFILEAPLDLTDGGWLVGDVQEALDVTEERRQHADIAMAGSGAAELVPWQFHGLPPLMNAWPTSL